MKAINFYTGLMIFSLMLSGCNDRLDLSGETSIPVRIEVTGDQGTLPIEQALIRQFYGLDQRRVTLSLGSLEIELTGRPCNKDMAKSLAYSGHSIPDSLIVTNLVNTETQTAIHLSVNGEFFENHVIDRNDRYTNYVDCGAKRLQSDSEAQKESFDFAKKIIEETEKTLTNNLNSAYLGVFDSEKNQSFKVPFSKAEFRCTLQRSDFQGFDHGGGQYEIDVDDILEIIGNQCAVVLSADF
ncbi:MAG: hypothetical protein CL678_03600 [Bdellovibrionaceae bacterium]|nr:hypothetical protein [Pseudobdellovibrionaceae bacterium]|tara:strand:+ start:2637 stop:3356 length:720 start_codon:yes stop_codon:yes gene_type:complete